MGSRNSNELLITLVNFTTPGLVRGQRVAKTLRQRVRTGLDIVRAIELGANFVMLGRAFLYGLAALGGRGGDHVFRLLKEDTRNNMMQLGVASVNALRHMRKDNNGVDAPSSS